MEIIRITFRVPKYIFSKVKILANDNNISINKQLIELIEFGIKYYFEIFDTKNFKKRLGGTNEKN